MNQDSSSNPYHIQIDVTQQELQVYYQDKLFKKYSISTAKNGLGEQFGSECTPRGVHWIRAKIGGQQPINTVFVSRRPTGEIYTPSLGQAFPDRDWILTRILWLQGLEPRKNRGGEVDTARRKIYIHGTPDHIKLGVPGSKGCIRMANSDIIDFFDFIPLRTTVDIQG